MKHTKYISIASSLGLSVALLAGCGVNDDDKKDKDNANNSNGGTNGGAFVGGGSHSSSTESAKAISGSKGIGTAKGGGASS